MLITSQWSENNLWSFWQLLTLLMMWCDSILVNLTNFFSCLVKTHTMQIWMNHLPMRTRLGLTIKTYFMRPPTNDPSDIDHCACSLIVLRIPNLSNHMLTQPSEWPTYFANLAYQSSALRRVSGSTVSVASQHLDMGFYSHPDYSIEKPPCMWKPWISK